MKPKCSLFSHKVLFAIEKFYILLIEIMKLYKPVVLYGD